VRKMDPPKPHLGERIKMTSNAGSNETQHTCHLVTTGRVIQEISRYLRPHLSMWVAIEEKAQTWRIGLKGAPTQRQVKPGHAIVRT
jgi:hypothetical protein